MALSLPCWWFQMGFPTTLELIEITHTSSSRSFVYMESSLNLLLAGGLEISFNLTQQLDFQLDSLILSTFPFLMFIVMFFFLSAIWSRRQWLFHIKSPWSGYGLPPASKAKLKKQYSTEFQTLSLSSRDSGVRACV